MGIFRSHAELQRPEARLGKPQRSVVVFEEALQLAVGRQLPNERRRDAAASFFVILWESQWG